MRCPTTSNGLHVSTPSRAAIHWSDRPRRSASSVEGVRARIAIASSIANARVGRSFNNVMMSRLTSHGDLEAQDETNPRSTRHGRMEVDVGYAANRFAWQARGVVVIDVARRGVENIEHVQGDPDIAPHFVAAIDVHERRGLRAHQIILRQRAGSEVSHPNAAEGVANAVDARPG